ncbi:uncharacterized protein LOC131934833 [Physella acuta]|uniref:uncharacterized protein LOC131934833 n=1 Tax=Physella acuta TaxID=109671 RepID=UPI0027DBAF5C|nr:uncharacterized protein LOC131934833 [Physella acuta]
MNALGCLPHDVSYTGHDERSSLAEMDFTNRFNTCPANETVGNLPCDDIIRGGSCQTPIESDPGFTFQLDVFGVCFNVTVIEVNGEKIDYIEMFEKLNIFVLPDTTTNKTEISESGKIKINFPSNFVAEISENNSRLINVTAVTLTGKCQEFGIRRKVGYSVGFYVGFNQQLQRGAVHVLPAPAG